jgi:serine/threonine protein phosphatase PrpC
MMFAIADGMGGQRGGHVASKIACQGLSDYYRRDLPAADQLSSDMKLSFLEEVIQATHDRIRRYGEENEKYAHLGTTLSVLVLLNNLALIAHVGDSRIYRLRHDTLEQLTEDHTLAQLSVEMGYLKLQQVSRHPLRHMLTQALGEGVDEVQTRKEEVEAGDIFLLCSDGLYGILSDDEIRETLLGESTDRSARDRLVEAALDKVGQDDITAIVVRV